MTIPGWPVVFRGTAAVAAGLVTPDLLRGPRFQRLLPDTYAPSDATPDLRLRSLAAYLWAGPEAVLCGYSAAELLGAPCAPWDAPAEVTVPAARAGPRSRPGIVIVRRDVLHPGEITAVDGVRVTGRLRTSFDLARLLPLDDGVVAVDALARGEFSPDLLLHFTVRYRARRGVRAALETLNWTDPRAGSPPETRLRLILVRAGLPRPVAQHPVLDDDRREALWLDLAYPRHRLGVEYDGGQHFATPEAARADARRHTRLVAAGWRVLRYTAADLRDAPDRIVDDVRRALAHRDAAQRD